MSFRTRLMVSFALAVAVAAGIVTLLVPAATRRARAGRRRPRSSRSSGASSTDGAGNSCGASKPSRLPGTRCEWPQT